MCTDINLILMTWNVQGGLKNRIKRELIIEKILEHQGVGVLAIQEPGDLMAEDIQDIRTNMMRRCGNIKILYQKNKYKIWRNNDDTNWYMDT